MYVAPPYSDRKVRDAVRQSRMCDLYRNGATLQEIGAEFQVSRERARQIITAAGVTRHDGGAHAQFKKRAKQRRIVRNRKRNARALLFYGCDYKTLEKLNDGLPLRARGTPAWAYLDQRRNAQRRSIHWVITFPQWMEVWAASGHLNERGRGRNGYCMARLHDRGPYAIDNVYIATIARNASDYQTELKRRGVTCADGWKRLPEMARRVNSSRETALRGQAV